MVFDYPLVILERHLDTFGHVNNATYLEIFEEARWDFIERNGYGHRQIMSSGEGPVVLEVTLKFKKEMRLRERVVVKSETIGYEGKIGKVRQWIENPAGEVHAEAVFTMAFFDLKARKIIPPSPAWLKAIGL
ncbi:MAG: acyl-CoA thioesterase [Bdellovibrionales bacterium]|nr:acyl-CoA thioesterase [Bdellovibrionales bacterium]